MGKLGISFSPYMAASQGYGAGSELCHEAAGLGRTVGGKRLKAVRFALIAPPGRVMRHARRLIIRLARGHPSYELLLRVRQRILALAAEPYRA